MYGFMEEGAGEGFGACIGHKIEGGWDLIVAPCKAQTKNSVSIPKQRNGVKLCSECCGKLLPYSTKNPFVVGTKGDEATIGMEFEAMLNFNRRAEEDFEKTAHVWAYFLANNFIATEDGTVDVEFKSPVYNNCKPLVKILGGIEAMVNDGYINVESNRYGTHLHIGKYNNGVKATISDEDILAIESIILANPEKARRVFGRCIGDNGWCGRYDPDDETSHGGWFTRRANTIEFRICRFKNAEQYLALAKMWRKISYAKNPVRMFTKWYNEQ